MCRWTNDERVMWCDVIDDIWSVTAGRACMQWVMSMQWSACMASLIIVQQMQVLVDWRMRVICVCVCVCEWWSVKMRVGQTDHSTPVHTAPADRAIMSHVSSHRRQMIDVWLLNMTLVSSPLIPSLPVNRRYDTHTLIDQVFIRHPFARVTRLLAGNSA